MKRAAELGQEARERAERAKFWDTFFRLQAREARERADPQKRRDREQAERQEWQAWEAAELASMLAYVRRGAGFLCFEALGLPVNATRQDVDQAYRRLARETHPDKGGTCEAFTTLQQAYEDAKQLT
jgi:hypothetical protein